MFEKYLITGATGFLGRAVLAQLRDSKAEIRALVMEGDPLARELSQNVRVITGDVCDEAALGLFFAGADEHTCVIHCAGMISVATHPGDRIYRVNVDGTRNILKFCRQCGVGKLVYVSSVHAIPEKPKGTEIAETTAFSPELVRGDYAKEQGHGHGAGAADGEGRAERQRRVPIGHHWAGRSGKGQHHEHAAVLPRGKAAAGGKGRI